MPAGRKIDYAAVMAALPATAVQLSHRMGCSRSSAAFRLKRVCELGLAHIEKWQRTAGLPLPVYVAGAGVDAVKPKAKTNAQLIRKSRRKKRREHALRQEEKQIALAQNVIPTKRQSIFSALGL